MSGSRTRFSFLLALTAAAFSILGCSPPPENGVAQRQDDIDFAEIESAVEMSADDLRGTNRLTIEPEIEPLKVEPTASQLPSRPKMATRGMSRQKMANPKSMARSKSMSAPTDEVASANTIDFTPRAMESFPMEAAANEVSAPLEITAPEPADAIPSETAGATIVEVYYATDRKAQSNLAQDDWLKMHFTALLSGLVYLISFAAVFVSSRKVLCGFIATIALLLFLYLGQTATLQWQTAKRLDDIGDTRYLSELSDSMPSLDYGKCEVSIPSIHKKGQIDRPSLIKLEFSENAERHMVLNRVIRSSKDEFYNGLLDVLDENNSNESLVFIHGYNVSFENAAKRTAQIVHDLEFKGAPICYSWSSYGSLANYTRDMANADATVLPLHDFLLELVERTGNTTVHLVAHSMGNRALLQALDRIAVSRNDDGKMFGQLVMAAPDVSAHDFKTRYASAAMQLADIVTLYASSKDRALLAATEIHGLDRAGMAGVHLITMSGIDTVDVSEIDTSFLGHSYYGNHPDLIKDLQAVVELSQPASKRRWLTQIFEPGGGTVGYFRFANLSRSADGTTPPSRR